MKPIWRGLSFGPSGYHFQSIYRYHLQSELKRSIEFCTSFALLFFHFPCVFVMGIVQESGMVDIKDGVLQSPLPWFSSFSLCHSCWFVLSSTRGDLFNFLFFFSRPGFNGFRSIPICTGVSGWFAWIKHGNNGTRPKIATFVIVH